MNRKLARAYGFLRERYLTVDPRTASLYRIVLGTLLCLDCIRHWGEARFLYSIEGAFPGDKHLFRPSSSTLFSAFHAFSTLSEVHVIFALGLLCHFFFLIGWRTRLFAILGFVFVTSMDSRVTLVENGGYIVVNLQVLWVCFLPVQKRFSVDAWLRSWRAKRESTLGELADRTDVTGERVPLVTLVGLIVIVNFALIYFFNVVNKTGQIWRTGHTVHYVLHLDRMVTGLGVFARETTPMWLLRVIDFATLSVEALIFVCVVSPRAREYTRPLAMILVTLLNGSFGIMMRLGPFSWFMIAWTFLLPLPIHWDIARRFYVARSRAVALGLDERSPLAMTIGRIVARLDGYERVTFVPAPAGAILAARRADEPGFETAPGAVLGRVVEALPFGKWALRVPLALGLGALFGVVVRRAPRVERYFGLSVQQPPERVPTPLSSRLRSILAYPREALLFYLMLAAMMQAWTENKAIPKSLPPPIKPGQVIQPDEQRALSFVTRMLKGRVIDLKPDNLPEPFRSTIGYPRLFQGWGMFAPNPIQEDGVLAVDAWTIDGRHIDPFTGAAPDLDLSDSRGEGLSQLRQDYGNRIRLDRNQYYREGLREYLSRWHEETGRKEDELVAFDVYWVRDKCPAPGSDKPYDNDAVPILTWRKPSWVPPASFPRIPRAPKTRSAEKWDERKTSDARTREVH